MPTRWDVWGGGAEEMSDLSRFRTPLPLSSSSSDIRRPCSTSVLRMASFLCNIGLIFYIGFIFYIGLIFLFIEVVSSLLFSQPRPWLWTYVNLCYQNYHKTISFPLKKEATLVNMFFRDDVLHRSTQLMLNSFKDFLCLRFGNTNQINFHLFLIASVASGSFSGFHWR